MNKKILNTAVIPGVLALAALLLSVSLPFNADRAAGFAIVIVLLAIASLEYGYSMKRLPNR